MEEFRYHRKHLLKYLKSKSIKKSVASLYIHIPFCRSKCPYCDFYSKVCVESDIEEKFTDILIKELSFWSEILDFSNLKTIYVGGGTPTILKAETLAELIEGMLRFLPDKIAEFTVEANPESVSEEKLQVLKKAGVTRVSLGVQSFNDRTLEFLGRIHSAARAKSAAQKIKASGLFLNIDIIYGIPGEDLISIKNTIEEALRLKPESISAYAFTFKGKRFRGRSLKKDEEVAREYELISNYLRSASYHHYEISNWAKPGYECLHNLNYWKRENYLGIGPSAASLIGSVRFQYAKSLNNFMSNEPFFFVENLSKEQELLEEFYLLIRTSLGAPLESLRKRGLKIDTKRLKSLQEEGLADLKDGRLVLSEKGMFVADSITLNLLD